MFERPHDHGKHSVLFPTTTLARRPGGKIGCYVEVGENCGPWTVDGGGHAVAQSDSGQAMHSGETPSVHPAIAQPQHHP